MFEDVAPTISRSPSNTMTSSPWSKRTDCSLPRAIGRCTSASLRPALLGKAPSILPGVRCALGRGHWRHDSRVSLRAAGRRGQGGLQTLGIHGIAPPQVRHHLLPELRPRPSGCDPARLRRHRRLKDVTAPIRVASWVASSTVRARHAKPTSAWPPAMARADLHQGQGHQDRARRPDRRHAAHHSERYRRPNGGRRSSPRQFHRPGRGPNPAPRSLIRPNRPSA